MTRGVRTVKSWRSVVGNGKVDVARGRHGQANVERYAEQIEVITRCAHDVGGEVGAVGELRRIVRRHADADAVHGEDGGSIAAPGDDAIHVARAGLERAVGAG